VNPRHGVLEPYDLLIAIQTQLTRLQREVTILGQQVPAPRKSAQIADSLSELRGVWAESVIDEEDFELAKLRVPEDLL
jgi:hypothetical protein